MVMRMVVAVAVDRDDLFASFELTDNTTPTVRALVSHSFFLLQRSDPVRALLACNRV